MSTKKMALVCTFNNQLDSLISSVCTTSGFELNFINNGREIPVMMGATHYSMVILDVKIEDPCVIDALDLLVTSKCNIPIIIIGDCEEKILLSIKYLGTLKKLSLYSMDAKTLDYQSFIEILSLIDKKSELINDEVIALALEKKQFSMYYQPKIAITNNKLIGVEALIRWNRPNHHLVPPDLFIPIAEKSGLIVPMTYWIIREVFRQCAEWKKDGITLNAAINLSAQLLTDVTLPDEISNLAKEYNVDPQNICFEITEAAAMNWQDIALEVLTRIRLKGYSLSIDDFGTGYSSLVELQRLPFNELKIDKSFVNELVYTQTSSHIISSIINLGRNLNMSLVAEGVEQQETLDKLKELGCDVIQGYLISQPLSVDNFTNWYKDKIDEYGIFKN